MCNKKGRKTNVELTFFEFAVIPFPEEENANIARYQMESLGEVFGISMVWHLKEKEMPGNIGMHQRLVFRPKR